MPPQNGTNGALPAPFTQSPLMSPLATRSPAPGTYSQNPILDAFGRPVSGVGDIAQQLPGDALRTTDKNAVAATIYRQIPITTIQTDWAPSDARQALVNLLIGLFDGPTQLVENIMGDSRNQAAMQTRTGGLFGAPIRFEVPQKYRKDKEALRCRDAFREAWSEIATEAALSELFQWTVHLGFGFGQLLWDTHESDNWIPKLSPWNPRYSYYHWLYFKYIAVGLDGQIPVMPGDGHWVLHAPHGEYRGWVRGAMRAIAPWWLARQYCLRDWARTSERHGMPWIKGKTPASADPVMIQQFRTALSQLGQDTVIQVMQGNDGQIGFDVELIEAKIMDNSGGFEKLKEACDTEIVLAIQGQNLTVEVKEGSFAAARVHGDVRQTMLESDARSLCKTVYTQISRPFAAFNYKNADIAPIVTWDVSPPEDQKMRVEVFKGFTDSVLAFRKAGLKVKNVERLAKSFGLNLSLGDLEEAPPIQGGGGLGGGGSI